MTGKAANKKLTPKQQAFVREYLIDLNASAAARRAGYSKKTAKEIGFNHLTKVHIQAAIKKAMDKRAERTEITQDRVLKEYARLAFLDPRQLFDDQGELLPLHKLKEEVAAAIAGFDARRTVAEDGDESEVLKYKFVDKRASLSDVAKHLGMFEKDNTQRRSDIPVSVSINGVKP